MISKLLWITLTLLLVAGFVLLSACNAMGKKPGGEARRTLLDSPQWQGDGFANPEPQQAVAIWPALKRTLQQASAYRRPEPLVQPPGERVSAITTEVSWAPRITWFGHSSFLLELDGKRLLVDPVWGERASPLSWAGGKRFFAPVVELEALLPLDGVVISHDHYDHLDMDTVRRLSGQPIRWFVPLGVGTHLQQWGVSRAQITELDWWQQAELGSLRLTATPARHNSGRSPLFTDMNATLWAGWAFQGQGGSVFYSGDTSMHSGFAEIGERLGPFDFTLIESGAYDPLWVDYHLGPEQAVIAHQLVGGKVMLPVHWGLFDLAAHGWTEPVERVRAAAVRQNVRLVLPAPGEAVTAAAAPLLAPWWPDLPWQKQAETPVWSTRVDHLIGASRLAAADPTAQSFSYQK